MRVRHRAALHSHTTAAAVAAAAAAPTATRAQAPRYRRPQPRGGRRRRQAVTRGMAARVSTLCAALLALAAPAPGATRELDPAACAARFDVQRDKIIRTEESRDMGARYLSELDVGSRAECRRLCCETDACDVFVYEEKSPGSCYLFNCGPPEDFRCKFTAHGNFSSGVLALSRRLAELQDQERLAQLRLATSTSPARPPTPSPPLPPAPAPTSPPSPLPRGCSRYQFECHSGGECIAVYNACDGVPQCADGSDEAPELGCPARAPPAALPPPPAPLAPVVLPSSPQMNAVAGGPPAVEAVEAAEGARWPSRLAEAALAPRRDRYPADSSHIFSHKGGLMQEGSSGAGEGAWPPRRAWPPVPEPAWGWPEPEPEPRRVWPVPPRPEPPPDRLQSLGPRPQSRPAVEGTSDVFVMRNPTAYEQSKTMPELPEPYEDRRHDLRDSPKKGLEARPLSPTAKPPPEVEATAPPPQRNRTVAAPPLHAPPLHADPPDHVHVFAAPHSADRDGPSDHPPAAVLLLVLGLCMAGAVCGGAVWRGSRGRRRGARLAHDADYLVNGMYL